MQGDFLAEVFGDALGYVGPLDGKEVWHREQHFHIGDETPDAVLGFFRQSEEHKPLAVIELKGPKVHLDRDRSNGRTAVAQCWDYLVNTPPECRWGIVSNIVSFRLYERNSTKRKYEHFTLQSLRDFDVFKQFYVLFHRQGLIDQSLLGPPRAVVLLKESTERQWEVGDQLYDLYSSNRAALIAELRFKHNRTEDEAIEMAQRLFDRIIFIAFCKSRRLLPENTVSTAYGVNGFQDVTNPRWQSFKTLFHFIDVGNEKHGIYRYNGGLFQPHAVDDLELPDEPWTTVFRAISKYDFAGEVNLEVLGHLFERSITELEKLKEWGLFGDKEKAERYASMPQSAKRKQLGAYYTPPQLTSRIVQYTVEELIAERFAAAAVEFGVPEEGCQPGRNARRRRILATMSRHFAEFKDRRSGLRQRRLPVPSLRRAGRALPRNHRPPRPVGRSEGGETCRSDSDVHSAGEPLRRRSLARGGRNHATGPLDSLGQSGPTACQAFGEHHPRQLAGSRPGGPSGRFRLA